MTKSPFALLAFSFLALSACEDPYPPTPHPNYAIGILPTPQGDIALAPLCPNWQNSVVDPFDNQPLPQFGCATAHNLASMIDQPDDLVEGRSLANARGVTQVGAIRRYDNNQSRGLITPGADSSQTAVTTAPTVTSSMTGDVTGGAGAAPASASAAAAP